MKYFNSSDIMMERLLNVFVHTNHLNIYCYILQHKENYSPITKTNIPCLMIGRYFDLFTEALLRVK